MSRVRLVICVGALVAVVLTSQATSAGAASKRSCTRGKVTREFKSGSVVVVARKLKRAPNSDVVRTSILACWTRTGKRFKLFVRRERFVPSTGGSISEGDSYELAGDRYLGVVRSIRDGLSPDVGVRNFDIKNRTALHVAKRCNGVPILGHPLDPGRTTGVQEFVFLPGGGLAYECTATVAEGFPATSGGLFLATSTGEVQLEPPAVDVRNLAGSGSVAAGPPRLYWTVVSGSTATVKSRVVTG